MSNEILTTKQCAEMLDMKMPTLYQYLSKGKIPHYKRGGRVYFFRHELIEWVKQGKVEILDVSL